MLTPVNYHTVYLYYDVNIKYILIIISYFINITFTLLYMYSKAIAFLNYITFILHNYDTLYFGLLQDYSTG